MTRLRQTRQDWSAARMALLLLAALAPAPARAAAGANCSLSATPLTFGKYVPSSSFPADFTAAITVTCTASGATAAPIHGTLALAGAGGFSARQLTNGTRHMRYQLYLDPARTAPWGNGGSDGATASISGVVGPAAPIRQVFTVYGRILARQSDALVGHYADQIAVVLNY
jgi:spore coat protein U-like protein